MTDNILPLPDDHEVARAVRTLTRDPVTKARATQILREELRSATPTERTWIVAAIALLARANLRPH